MCVETRRILVKHSGKKGSVANHYSEDGYDYLIAVDCENNIYWIIPKNIPLEPEVKHLAIKVDNESLRFLESDEESVNEKFSEVKLKVWDRGRWGLMRGDIENGAISFNLFGKIIKARYTMQKLREDKKKNQKNHWVIWRVTGYKIERFSNLVKLLC